MSTLKTAEEIMVDVFEFPHMPYWFSIKQAIRIIKKSLFQNDKCIRPMVILIFDEKYNLVGTAGLNEILKGIEPRLADNAITASDTDKLFDKVSKETVERPISEVMLPVSSFVEPDDPIQKAAFIMVKEGVPVVPVLENKKKLLGVVKMVEAFNELSNISV